MTWLLFAFCGPVLWAASTHIDKYLVERFFKKTGVGTLLIFTSLIGLIGLPIIWTFVDVSVIGSVGITVTSLSGLLYMIAMSFSLRALQIDRMQFVGMLRKDPGAVIGINAANELINLGGGLAARYASILGPVSLVQAIGGTTSFFVFVFGVVLSLFFPRLGREDLSRGSLVQKGIAVALIVAGVILIGGDNSAH